MEEYYLQVTINNKYGNKKYYHSKVGTLIPDYLVRIIVKEEEESGGDSLVRDLTHALLKFTSKEDATHYLKVFGYTNHSVVSRESIVDRLFD